MSPRRVIGIDTGGTKLLGGVVDESLAVRDRVHRLWRGGDRRAILDMMVDAVEEARAAAPDAEAVGFGVPGLLDSATGAVGFSTHLPIEGLRFRDLMGERLGLPVFVDNDANLAALAEQRAGAARGAAHVAMLTLGTGVGGGLVLGGRLYRGAYGGAAELGHVVVDMDGPPCQGNCPNHGCLEAMASGTAIGREGAAAGERAPDSALGRELRAGREITGALVTELAHDGDEVAREVLAVAGERLGVGIASIVNALNPEVVVVGGAAIGGGDLLLEPARRVVAERALPPSRDQVRIERAELGEEAGMIGAAILAFEDGRV